MDQQAESDRRGFAAAFLRYGGWVVAVVAVALLVRSIRPVRPPVIIKGGSLELMTFSGELPLNQHEAKPEYDMSESAKALQILLVSFCAELTDEDYENVKSISVELGSGRYLTLELDTAQKFILVKANKHLDHPMKSWKHPDGANYKIKKLTITLTNDTTPVNVSGDDLKFLIWVK